MRVKSFSAFLIVLSMAAWTPAGAQVGPATAAGISADQAAAARRVMMHALQGGNQGGCTPLPGGWSSLTATVNFPASYGGYGEWVNNAELLPVGENLQSFLSSHSGGHFVQTAYGTSNTVHTTLCAPAGYSYWLIVDSGTSKVAIGRVTLRQPGRAYRGNFTAPPLGSRPSSGTQTSYTQPTYTQPTYAQPSTTDQLLQSWTVSLPSLGMSAIQITPQLLNLLHARPDMRGVRGIVIVTLTRGGWAWRRGFHQYDIVTSVNGRRFTTISQFEQYLNAFGGSSPFSIVRGHQYYTLSGGMGSGNSGWRPPVVGGGYIPPGAASTPCPC